MHSILKVLFFLVVCTSCHGPVIGQSQDVIIVDTLRRQNNFTFAKNGLVRVGIVDAYNPDLGTLTETYQTRKMRFLTVDAARAFFVKTFAEYVAHFNADSRLCTLIKGHPFGAHNASIQITVLDEHGSPPNAPEIARIRNSQNTIIFYTYDKNQDKYTQIAQEPF
jgi:hypothetical protein